LAAEPNNVVLLRQRAAHDRAALAFAEKLRRRGTLEGQKYVDTVTGYFNDLNSTLGTIASLTKKATDAAKTTRMRIPAHIAGTAVIPGLHAFGVAEQRSFTAGFGNYMRAFGPITGWQIPMSLQIAQARAGAFGTSEQQNAVLRRIKESAMKALKSGRLMGQAWIDVYDTIAGINQQLAQVGGPTKFRRSLRGTMPAYGLAGAHPHAIVIHGDLVLQGIQDVTALENALEARAKRRPQPRRGR
jgi:hypothetical protein